MRKRGWLGKQLKDAADAVAELPYWMRGEWKQEKETVWQLTLEDSVWRHPIPIGIFKTKEAAEKERGYNMSENFAQGIFYEEDNYSIIETEVKE